MAEQEFDIDNYKLVQDLKDEHFLESPSIVKAYKNLNRFKIRFPDHELENTIGHVFITKPDLNLFENGSIRSEISNRPEFHDYVQSDYFLFEELSDKVGNPIQSLLSNAIENVDIGDEISRTRVFAETSNGYKITYGSDMIDSRTANSFNAGFLDDRNTSIYKLLSIWCDYYDLISVGKITPSDYNRENAILDYVSSLYYFLTAEDGETIIFYTKYWGVYPNNKPSSAFSWQKGEHKKLAYNVQMNYSFKRDMHPLIIRDFNKIAGDYYGKPYLPIYNSEKGETQIIWANGAYVEMVNGRYKLRWV